MMKLAMRVMRAMRATASVEQLIVELQSLISIFELTISELNQQPAQPAVSSNQFLLTIFEDHSKE